jgi:hypothetical protein
MSDVIHIFAGIAMACHCAIDLRKTEYVFLEILRRFRSAASFSGDGAVSWPG